MENISLDKSKGKIKIGDRERKILSKLKKSDTFGKLDKVKPIWDEISEYDVEDVDIGIKCSKYLNKAGKSGLLPIKDLYTECYKLNKYKQSAEIKTKREDKSQEKIGTRKAGGRRGRVGRATTDRKLTDKQDEKIDAKHSPKTMTDLLEQLYPNIDKDKIRLYAEGLSKSVDNILTTPASAEEEEKKKKEEIKRLKEQNERLKNLHIGGRQLVPYAYDVGITQDRGTQTADDEDDEVIYLEDLDRIYSTFELDDYLKQNLEQYKNIDRIPNQGEANISSNITSLVDDTKSYEHNSTIPIREDSSIPRIQDIATEIVKLKEQENQQELLNTLTQIEEDDEDIKKDLEYYSKLLEESNFDDDVIKSQEQVVLDLMKLDEDNKILQEQQKEESEKSTKENEEYLDKIKSGSYEITKEIIQKNPEGLTMILSKYSQEEQDDWWKSREVVDILGDELDELENFIDVSKDKKYTDVKVGGDDIAEPKEDKAFTLPKKADFEKKLKAIMNRNTNEQLLEILVKGLDPMEENLNQILESFRNDGNRLATPNKVIEFIELIPDERFKQSFKTIQGNIKFAPSFNTKNKILRFVKDKKQEMRLKGKTKFDTTLSNTIISQLIKNFNDFDEIYNLKPIPPSSPKEKKTLKKASKSAINI